MKPWKPDHHPLGWCCQPVLWKMVIPIDQAFQKGGWETSLSVWASVYFSGVNLLPVLTEGIFHESQPFRAWCQILTISYVAWRKEGAGVVKLPEMAGLHRRKINMEAEKQPLDKEQHLDTNHQFWGFQSLVFGHNLSDVSGVKPNKIQL